MSIKKSLINNYNISYNKYLFYSDLAINEEDEKERIDEIIISDDEEKRK